MDKSPKYKVIIFGDSIVFGSNDPFGGWATRLKEYYHQKEFLEKSELKKFIIWVLVEIIQKNCLIEWRLNLKVDKIQTEKYCYNRNRNK
jgi:hypothetical protein